MHGYVALLAFSAHFSKNQGWLVQGREPPRNRTLYDLLRVQCCSELARIDPKIDQNMYLNL